MFCNEFFLQVVLEGQNGHEIFLGVKISIPSPKQIWDISIPTQKFFLPKHFENSIPPTTNFGQISVPPRVVGGMPLWEGFLNICPRTQINFFKIIKTLIFLKKLLVKLYYIFNLRTDILEFLALGENNSADEKDT